ncbi:glutamyl-tRNA reductase [Sanguibacter sp. 25GB23B1]|uniref:glutamyl-tRNA reductase n=1 Tax=unclassified Sanguibacter TaxID=2645534 RepID=UPI0032AF13EE
MSMTASHHELDLEALEQLSNGAHSMGKSAVQACEMITGAVVLATCNRFELYLDVADPPSTFPAVTERDLQHAALEIAHLIAEKSGASREAARSAFTVRSGPDVAAHLFSVAAGLDSMVVGEREIAGQVRRALDAAHVERTTSSRLERLFQRASRTSKRISHETHLGADGRSVVSVGLDLAEPSIPPWRQTSAVIVGTGAYAGASIAALRSRGCTDISVYSASGRAPQFAADRGVTAVSDLVEALEAADLVVSCSGAGGRRAGAHALEPAAQLMEERPAPRPAPSPAGPHAVTLAGDATDPHASASTDSSVLDYVLQSAAVVTARERASERAGEEGPQRPLVVLDLALHHDVDPRVGDIDNVLLMDLATIRAHAPSTSSEPVLKARAIVRDAVEDYTDREAVRSADKVVVALRTRIEAELEAELERSARDFSTPADVEAHARSLRRLAGALLHRGIVRIREAARSGEPLDEIVADLTDPDSALDGEVQDATVLSLTDRQATQGGTRAG